MRYAGEQTQTMNNDFQVWLVPAVIAVVVAELFLSSTWNRSYFRNGIPIFRRSYDAIPGRLQIPSVAELEAALKSRYSHSIVFRQLDSREYAFREKAFEFTLFHATPVMHGLLRWDSDSGKVSVVGYANWFMLGFTLLWFSMMTPRFSFFMVFFILAVGLLYFIQAKRFDKVGKIACEKWVKAGQFPSPDRPTGG